MDQPVKSNIVLSDGRRLHPVIKPRARTEITDPVTGLSISSCEWNLSTEKKQTIKKRFKNEIQAPLQQALNEFRHNPNATLSDDCSASIVGLLLEVMRYLHRNITLYSSNPGFDMFTKPSNNNMVATVRIHGISYFRKLVLSITGEEGVPISMLPMPFEIVQKMLTGPYYAAALRTLKIGLQKPGKRFPILILFQIKEMAETPSTDTWVQSDIIYLDPDDRTQTMQEESVTPTFEWEVTQHRELVPYLDGICLVCQQSGVFKLLQCSGCKMARYCCKEHQKEHWKEHKHHCKKLKALKEKYSK